MFPKWFKQPPAPLLLPPSPSILEQNYKLHWYQSIWPQIAGNDKYDNDFKTETPRWYERNEK